METVCSHDRKSDLPVIGFLAVKGTPAFRKALPFAGRRRNDSLGRLMRTEGASSPPLEESTTHRGARVSSYEEGSPTRLVVLRQQASRHRVLRSGLLGSCSPASPANGHRRKRWSDRGVARKQRFDRMVAFVSRALATCLQRGGARHTRDCHDSHAFAIRPRQGKVSGAVRSARDSGGSTGFIATSD
jgi:hypothetical protein